MAEDLALSACQIDMQEVTRMAEAAKPVDNKIERYLKYQGLPSPTQFNMRIHDDDETEI